MQCGCPECGRLMAKVERGLSSVCRCDQCDTVCSACIGNHRGLDRTIRRGMAAEDWERLMDNRHRED